MKALFKALSRASDGAFIIDQRYRIIYWNQAAERLLGFTLKQALDRQCYELLGGRDGDGRTLCQRYCRVAMSIYKGKAHPNIDVYSQTRSGQGRWINVTTLAFPTSDQGMGQVIVHLFRDASGAKRAERLVDEISMAMRKLRRENEGSDLSMPAPGPTPSLDRYDLTQREQEVLILLAHGFSTQRMARRLNITSSTTRNHVQSILTKLGVHSRLEAVALAYKDGLVELPSD
jgi:PAS domain S-box-containing protein